VPDIAKLQVVVGADTSDAEKGLGRVNSAISGFGTVAKLALAGAATGIIAAGAAAVGAAADFESVMSGVKAVSGATNAEMKGLSDLALQLGKDTSFSASEAAAGIEELVKGGLSIADVMNGAAKSTLSLAAAGGVSLPEAANIAANALNQFGLKGTDMAHVADLIAGAANASALSVSDFQQSLSMAGGVASLVGFSFDDLAVAIAAMGKAGYVGSDAGTSLKTMFLNLSPQTDKAKKEMQELGIITADGANQFFDAAGKVKSMAEVAGVLEKATKDLSEEQRTNALATIFGTDAIRAAGMMSKESAGGLNTLAGAMGKVTAASVEATKLDNLTGSIGQLTGSLSTAAVELGTAFLPMLRKATDGATGFINAAIPWIKEHGPLFVASLESVVAAAGRVVTAFGENGLLGGMKALGAQGGVLRPAWDRLTASLSDFAPTGERIERLFNTIGTALGTVLPPIVAWMSKAGGEKGLLWNLAAQTNAWSESIERNIDDTRRVIDAIRPYVELLGKAGDAWDRLARSVVPTLPSIPGITVPASPGGAQGWVNGRPVSRDAGGPGYPGQSYLIGTGAQPERFVPDRPGMFFPNAGGGARDDRPIHVALQIDGSTFGTLVARANNHYARRGGRSPYGGSHR
jgi:TP901 family phage tail tape measure protein